MLGVIQMIGGKIVVDGKWLYVTTNLYEALLPFRSELKPGEKLFLWANAVCPSAVV